MKWKVGAGITLLMLLIWGLTGPRFNVNLDKRTYSAREEPELTVRNVGLTPIYFGQGYLLYRWKNGSWVEMKTPFFFIARLYELAPFPILEAEYSSEIPAGKRIPKGAPRGAPPLPRPSSR